MQIAFVLNCAALAYQLTLSALCNYHRLFYCVYCIHYTLYIIHRTMMGANLRQIDSEKMKVIIGKLINKADPIIRPVISVFDVSKISRSVICQRLNQFKIGLLENCAEFLGIALADKDNFKLFVKETLCTRIFLALMALMPSKCGECREDYVVDHEPETQPFFHCFRCFKGSHDCERNKTLHETLSSLNTPTGFVWLCDECHSIVDPIEPRKQRSRHASQSLSENQSSNSGNDVSNLALQNALSSTQYSANASQEAASPPADVCKKFLDWNCPHGISGKKQIAGKGCPFTHPRVCNEFRNFGSSGRNGCKKGANCDFFHPDICQATLTSGSCSKKNCPRFHPRASRKKSAPKKEPSPRTQKEEKPKNRSQNHSNPSSSDPTPSDFLELRNLVTGMSAKLEMLEKKMCPGYHSTPILFLISPTTKC